MTYSFLTCFKLGKYQGHLILIWEVVSSNNTLFKYAIYWSSFDIRKSESSHSCFNYKAKEPHLPILDTCFLIDGLLLFIAHTIIVVYSRALQATEIIWDMVDLFCGYIQMSRAWDIYLYNYKIIDKIMEWFYMFNYIRDFPHIPNKGSYLLYESQLCYNWQKMHFPKKYTNT